MTDQTSQIDSDTRQDNQTLLATPDQPRRWMPSDEHLVESGKALLTLSHALKNILQMVGGAAEVIDYALEIDKIDKVRQSWGIFISNLQRLKKFLLDFLDYTKQRPLELSPCDPNNIVRNIVESMKNLLKQKKIKLQVHLDSSAIPLMLDEDRVGLMTLNMIINAIDMVEEGSGLVRIETHLLPDSGQLEIVVSDNATTIDEQVIDNLLTPFESHHHRFGCGIGLPLALQIAEQHGGTLELHTLQNQGHTARVILPAKTSE
jgi:signal transduction histidine kinase